MDDKSLTLVENGSNNKHIYGNNEKSIIKDKMHKNDFITELNNSSNGVTTTVNIANDVILPDSVLEKLYHSYSIKQRRSGLIWFLVASILFNIWAIAIPQGHCWLALCIFLINVLLNIILLILLLISGDSKLWQMLWEKSPNLAWFLAISQFIEYLFLKPIVTPRDILGWAILLIFLILVSLPVPLVCTGILFAGGFFIIYLIVICGAANRDQYFMEQVTANGILLLAAGIIGLLYYFLGEAKQKRAFLEAKKSLEVKMVIEEQSAEQERLLLSVLPEHVAVKMRQDLGSTNSEQFKKIYMSRHENVSILYADIVGFTAISSTYSAQDLVKMLNELFARFDRLAEKYQQLRIKILGDCYYCISGAPVEREDHAVLCVHMGLSMVKAIKYVQQKTNSPVDMRVGIHTGAILAGILGQRQWQFDVYSKDVELANKMESSGKAGRVHISEKTLGFLSGQFEVEPAFGEKREEALRIAGLKTYFITKVLVPFVPQDHERINGTASSPTPLSDDDDDVDPNPLNNEKNENENDGDSTEIIPDEESKANSDEAKTKEEDFQQRLRKELVARDGHGDLSKDTTIFLSFKNEELEKAYSAHREPYSSVPLLAAVLVQIIDIFYSSIILSRDSLHLMIISMPLLLIILLVGISIAESFPLHFSETFVNISKKFNDIGILRRLSAILIIFLLGCFNLIDMFSFAYVIPERNCNTSTTTNIITTSIIKHPMIKSFNDTVEIITTIPATTTTTTIEPHQLLIINNISDFSEPSPCSILYPSYLSNFSVLILIAIAVIAQLTHICKIFFMILFTVLHCLANIFVLQNEYNYEDYLGYLIGLPIRFTASTILFVVAISLSFLARHMDKEDRVIFKWKTEVAEQKEKVSDMRRRNEALVYNVLPVHVAEHFMKNRKRSHDDLYSHSYAEVGVLFASMPNFTDFYSEETVNNQGLECLRFLNEVISDYDALLELPQFQDIAKIKTIGSTYMAASGLNPSRQVKPDDPIIVRWAHLALLVEFALELKKALTGINEQSFNHFVLKMGINHGPITAGVIGARKPHYDIWGNTVNVASRMESTGKAGAIQVTEETTQILQTFGYTFEQRGLVSVKGKGELMTYYLQGKISRPNPPASPISAICNTMDPLPEVDEPIDSPKNGQIYIKNKSNNNNDNLNQENNLSISNSSNNNNNNNNNNHHNSNNQQSTTAVRNILNLKIDNNNTDDIIDSFPPPECDPRSPKSISSLNNCNQLSSSSLSPKINDIAIVTATVILITDSNNDCNNCEKNFENGIDNIELDVDLVDVQTPLLNLNSTNLENREFISNNSEKDSLIAND